jgi:hypothetical protein
MVTKLFMNFSRLSFSPVSWFSINSREREHDPFFLAVSVMLLPQTGPWAKGKRKRGRKKFSSNKKRKQEYI